MTLGESYAPPPWVRVAAERMAAWSPERIARHWEIAQTCRLDTEAILAAVEERLAQGESLEEACFGMPAHPEAVNRWAWIRSLVEGGSEEAGGEE